MIYPTIEKLTGGEFNRYELVIGVAKGARIVTDKYVEMRQKAQKMIEIENENPMHLVLVSRGDIKRAKELLNTQDEILDEIRERIAEESEEEETEDIVFDEFGEAEVLG